MFDPCLIRSQEPIDLRTKEGVCCGGPSNRPRWSLYWRVSPLSPPHPLGRMAPPPYPAGVIGVRVRVMRGGPCSRSGIRRPCRSKTADSKALGSPGREVRAEPSNDPE